MLFHQIDHKVVETWYLLGWLNRIRATTEDETGYDGNVRFYLARAKEVHKKNPTDDADMVRDKNEKKCRIIVATKSLLRIKFLKYLNLKVQGDLETRRQAFVNFNFEVPPLIADLLCQFRQV